LSSFEGQEPLPDLATLLNSVKRVVRTFVVVSEAQQAAIALWVFHTWTFHASDATPYLSVTSADKRCGKSTLLEVLECLVVRPFKTGAGLSTAALTRLVARQPPPTLLLDEGDNTFKKEREYVATVMAILNDGYRRGGKAVLCLPPGWKVGELSVFAPKAIAGIGDLPDTVADRSIPIRLVQRTREELIERNRERARKAAAAPVVDALRLLAQEYTDILTDARPDLPDELDDRAQDVWEPLLAIADAAGGDWPERARAAAVELMTGEEREDESTGARLLRDIRTVFDSKEEQRYKTADLIRELANIEESPWGDWRGKDITPQAVSKLLKPYRIKTMAVWVDGQTVRGYRREQFEEAWLRVLGGVEVDALAEPVGGVRAVRDVRSQASNQDRPNAPNAPNAEQGSRGNGHVPADAPDWEAAYWEGRQERLEEEAS
jgi:hypothetical protein